MESNRATSLGSFDQMTDQSMTWRQQSLWAFPAVDGEPDTADAEPALGSLDGRDDLTAWAAGDRRDLERDDGEGWADNGGPTRAHRRARVGYPQSCGAHFHGKR